MDSQRENHSSSDNNSLSAQHPGSRPDSSRNSSSDEAERQYCGTRFLKRLKKLHATNLKLNPVDPGNWDGWGVYYCSSRFGRHTHFNSNYFALAAIVVIGQSNFFHLIHLMQENGGAAFLVVLIMTYIFFGYPAYMMEMLMGQYSGRKPLQMIRLLLPLFSGLGVGMYLRTLFRAINNLGLFANCLYHCWDLLFCQGAYSVMLKRIVTREKSHRQFKLFHGLTHTFFTSDPEDGDFDQIKWLMYACALGVGLCFIKKLSEFGAGMKVVLRLLLLFLIGYTFNGYSRINPSIERIRNYTNDLGTSKLLYIPLQVTFSPKWIQIINGGAWVKATMFVMNSMELGSLVHPYLGSKVFFHYRCTRDGIYLILLTITWHLVGVFGVLIWLGYVGITEDEIRASLKEIDGHYGMFVVFIMKHVQAELTQQVESDVLLFCSVFYFIIGTAAFLSCICYMYVLADCAVPESGHSMIKLITTVWYIVLFGLIFFPMTIAKDGLRHLIFLNFYGGNSWSGLFMIACFSIAVWGSQGIARVLYDFYNMIHLKGYELRTHYFPIPKIVVILFTLLPLISLLSEAIEHNQPTEGATDWSDETTVLIGNLILFSPIISVVFGALYYLATERNIDKTQPIFQPHRDFYKNKYHTSICFNEYMFFDVDKIKPITRITSYRNINKSRL